MASTYIPFTESEVYLSILEGAYRNFYRNSDDLLIYVHERSKAKNHSFYDQVSKDSKKFIKGSGFSSSWIWSLLFDEDEKNRKFHNPYLRFFDSLIIFYENHIFIEYDEDDNAVYKRVEDMLFENIVNDVPEQYGEEQPQYREQDDVIETEGTYGNEDYPRESAIPHSKKSFISQWKFIFIVLISLGFGYYAVSEIRNFTKRQQKLNEERNIIENAKAKSTARVISLNNVYRDIDKELENNNKRNLSESLMSRIILLSEDFKPYDYIEGGVKYHLSPERSNLFLFLIRSNLDVETLSRLLTHSNFSYSDLSGADLSGLDFSKFVYGVKAVYKQEFQGLITPFKRINFSYSNFNKTDFENSVLYGNFLGSDFRGSTLNNTVFIWSELACSNFSGNTLLDVFFKNSDIKSSDFRNTKNKGFGGFINCDVRGVVFDNSEFSGGIEAFVFDNCFLSSKGTFFEYELFAYERSMGIIGTPYIEESPIHTEDTYFAYRDNFTMADINNGKPKIPKVVTASDLDSAFTFFGNKKQEKYFFNHFRDADFVASFNYYTIRTNDNINRSSKCLRSLTRFDDRVWDISEIKTDTLYRRSDLNKLEMEYRGLKYNYPIIKNIYGNTSFKNCQFIFTYFKNLSLEYVSFKESKFINYNKQIGNYFINTKLFSNDFRVDEGLFLFDKRTTYDNLQINKKFPALFFLDKKDSLNNDFYKKHLYKKKNEKEYINSFYENIDSRLEWADQIELTMKVDTLDDGNFVLRKK